MVFNVFFCCCSRCFEWVSYVARIILIGLMCLRTYPILDSSLNDRYKHTTHTYWLLTFLIISYSLRSLGIQCNCSSTLYSYNQHHRYNTVCVIIIIAQYVNRAHCTHKQYIATETSKTLGIEFIRFELQKSNKIRCQLKYINDSNCEFLQSSLDILSPRIWFPEF